MTTNRRRAYLFFLSLMGCAAFLPIWRIEIWAPQYPEGLLMQIRLNSMSGNIDQVNILNHYVGMKHIVPSEIPELHIVPSVFVSLLALGLLAVWLKRRRAMLAWFASLIAGFAVGLLDLYLWGYDYGHNLSRSAPIKIPGMSFQPPLIGHKTLLNIDSYSFPDVGGLLIGAAVTGIFVTLYWDNLRQLAGQVIPQGKRP